MFTTEYNNIPKIAKNCIKGDFVCPEGKNDSAETRSPLQDLKEGTGIAPYLLVSLNRILGSSIPGLNGCSTDKVCVAHLLQPDKRQHKKGGFHKKIPHTGDKASLD